MNGRKLRMLACLAAAALVLLGAGNALAKASGPCVDCHTMHNSQDGDAMRVDKDTDGNPITDPARALLKAGSCYGCHGDVAAVNGTWNGDLGRTPRINATDYGTDGVTGDTLAGGSFKWVDVDGEDAKGHNVLDVAEMDALLDFDPPGFNVAFPDNAGGKVNGGTDVAWVSQLTCAGVYGCHGIRQKDGADVTDQFAAVKGGHHSGPTGYCDGSDLPNSYRFLMGIKGVEDNAWEYQPTAIKHNVYFGEARSADTISSKQTISYLCAECHGNFHSGALKLGAGEGTTFAAPWLRHPTDFDMQPLGATVEYADYNGDGSVYSVVAPVAVGGTAFTTATVANDWTWAADKTIVTCISCHRAHGSPYNDLLRWAYNEDDGTTTDAASGDGNVGCFICHTTKDDI